MSKQTITIGIITHGRQTYLKQAIDSALAQTIPADQILIVQDGQSAETTQVIDQYKSIHNLNFIVIPKSNRSRARNTVVLNTKTDFLVWLDDDDTLHPELIEHHLKTLNKSPSADIIFGDLVLCDSAMNYIRIEHKTPIQSFRILYDFILGSACPNPGTLIRMSSFDRVGLYDEFFERGQDYDFFSRAASLKLEFVHHGRALCNYRSHKENAALASQQKAFYHFRAQVVRNILSRHSLQEIFTIYNWNEFPARSSFQSRFDCAVQCIRFRCYSDAIKILSEETDPEFGYYANYVAKLLDGVQKEGVSALNRFMHDEIYFDCSVQNAVTLLLIAELDEDEVDKFRIAHLQKQLEIFPIEKIQPSGHWETSPNEAFTCAAMNLTSEYLKLGAYDLAKEMFSRTSNYIGDSLVLYVNKLITLYSTDGLKALELTPRTAEYYSYIVQNLLPSLGYREKVLRQRNLEREIATGHIINKLNTEDASAHYKEYNIEFESKLIEYSKPLLEGAASILNTRTKELELGSLSVKRETTEPQRLNNISIKPLITVVIPTYNRSEYLLDSVSSISAQNCAIEAIIVNDGSSELPQDLLIKLATLPISVTVVNHLKNYGLAASRNTGALLARGDWLIFLDDDDFLIANAAVALIKEAINKNSKFVYGDHQRLLYDNSLPLALDYRSLSDKTHEEILGVENLILTASYAINRELFFELGGFNEKFLVHEDYNFHLRVAFSTKITYLQCAIMNYNVREAKRMNVSKRAFWFATSAYNHELYRTVDPNNLKLKEKQRSNQIEHLSRAIAEDLPLELAKKLVFLWWNSLLEHNLLTEIEYELPIYEYYCPNLVPLLKNYFISQSKEVPIKLKNNTFFVDKSETHNFQSNSESCAMPAIGFQSLFW